MLYQRLGKSYKLALVGITPLMKETVQKPWGWYKDLERHHDLVIKKLYIKPLSRFSLQKHFKRDEFWYIVSGTGTITIDSLIQKVEPGNCFSVGRGSVHRLEADADGLTFVEVQKGECSEDDIIRLEDDYDRVTDGL